MTQMILYIKILAVAIVLAMAVFAAGSGASKGDCEDCSAVVFYAP